MSTSTQTANSSTGILDEHELYLLTCSQLQPILLDHARNNEPCFIFGDPGCGKTTIIDSVANQVGKPTLFYFNLATSDGTEFGVPTFDENRTLHFAKEEHWHFRAGNPTTVFFDEWAQGSTLTQCAATPILRENRVRDLFLHTETWRVGASNFPKNKCATNKIPAHTLNNLYCYGLVYDAESQVEYMLGQPEDEVDLLTVRFLRMKGDTAFYFDPTNTINATPRQWTNASKKLAQNPNASMATISALIGKGNASELTTFRSLAPTLPTPEEILMAPKTARLPDSSSPHFPSACFLITDMMADRSSVNTFDALVEYAKRMPPEYQGKFAKDAVARSPEVMSTRAFVEFGVKFAEVLR